MKLLECVVLFLLLAITTATWSQTKSVEIIHVSKAEFPLAKMKADLVQLLIDSLRDQGKGKVDVKREAEIRRLMERIQNTSEFVKEQQ